MAAQPLPTVAHPGTFVSTRALCVPPGCSLYMESQGLVDRLVDAGVLEPAMEGDELGFSSGFQAAMAEEIEAAESGTADDRREMIETAVEDPDIRSRLEGVVDMDPAFVGFYLSIIDWIEDVPPEQSLSGSVTLYQILDQAPRSEGAPNHFLPIHGDNLGLVSSLFERCVAYIWRDNCPTCETVREDFDEIFGGPGPGDLVLVSIYGPDSADYLNDKFDVIGGPTVLFLLNGQVDARLQGAHRRDVLENEIETIQNRTIHAP